MLPCYDDGKHDEAARSFRTAAKLDNTCAMCYWGVAIVKGPNINAVMEADAVPEAWDDIYPNISNWIFA